MLRNSGNVVDVAVVGVGFVIGCKQAFYLLYPHRLQDFEAHMAIEEEVVTRPSWIDHQRFNQADMLQ